jgi:pimeloyl-ACP methyl ester carboxylesterase
MESSANAAKTQRMTIDGTQIAFRIIGQGQNQPPLVLCHRFRATMDDWDPALQDELARQRQVIVFDSAGVGGSGGRTPVSVAEMAAIAGRFILSQADQVDTNALPGTWAASCRSQSGRMPGKVSSAN